MSIPREVRTTAGTREKLLAAAEELFLEKGYDGVSVRDVTERAGVNVAAINYHFQGKQNLYREFFRRRLTESVSQKTDALLSVVPAEGEPRLEEVIRMFVREFLEDMLSSRESEQFLNIFFSELSGKGTATDILFEEGVYPMHRVLLDAFRRARPDMPETKLVLSMASIFGQMVHFVRARELVKRLTRRAYSREFIDEIVEHITDFSLKGMGE
jgi:AcrR family transcriptional regulator